MENEKKTIEIKIPNTNFWVYGEQQEDYLWDAYLTNPLTGYKEKFRSAITTRAFAMFSSLVLKTPFPYEVLKK